LVSSSVSFLQDKFKDVVDASQENCML